MKKTTFKKTVLHNGLTIISESDKGLYSTSIGLFVRNGSRHERTEENGISHFVEHMLFKGTPSRSCLDIARQIDALGGALNAYTTRENTCFYAKVLPDHLPTAVDILSDIFLNSLFDEGELEKERQVILQEISSADDTPDDLIHDLFYKTFFAEHPLYMPVAGSLDTVSAISREDLVRFFHRRYTSDRVVIALSGDLDHGRIVEGLSKKFSSLRPGVAEEETALITPGSRIDCCRKDLGQVHLCLGTAGIESASEKRHAAYLLNTVLGGGMSSRLFQKVREERGLVYSIFSYLSTYRETGLFGVYAATGREHLAEVLDLVVCEMRGFREELVPVEEFDAAKEQMRSNVLFSMETSDSRMQRIAACELELGRHVPVAELLNDIDAVTREDVLALAQELFSPESLNLTLLGDFDGRAMRRKMAGLREMLGPDASSGGIP